MTEQPSDNRQDGISRGVFLVVCLVVAIVFVTTWVKLASRDAETGVVVQQPANEQGQATDGSLSDRQGDWYISLASFRLEKDALSMIKRLRQQGVNADSVAFIGQRKGYIWHRVRVSGFSSEQEAQQGLDALSRKINTRNAWIGKNP